MQKVAAKMEGQKAGSSMLDRPRLNPQWGVLNPQFNSIQYNPRYSMTDPQSMQKYLDTFISAMLHLPVRSQKRHTATMQFRRHKIRELAQAFQRLQQVPLWNRFKG